MPSSRTLAGVVAFTALLGQTWFSRAGAPDSPPASEADRGVLPTDTHGVPLNLDFETGTLKDWKAEGPAFEGQPIEGDTVAKRKKMRSRHEGRFWIGGYERKGD